MKKVDFSENKLVYLSVIILNYNTKDFLVKCLQSLRQAQGKLRIEIIVVDNGSTDGSVEAVRNFQFPHSNFHFIQNTKNIGFSKGNNIGVRRSSGKYVLFLNPDTILSANVLKVVFEFMEKHPDVVVASPRLELADGSLDESSHRGFPTPWNTFCHFSGLRSLFPKSRLFAGYTMGWLLDETTPHEVDSISGAFFFVRRRVGEEVGWWDEDYFWYGEDLDFCYRVKKKGPSINSGQGWKVMFLPDVKVLHYRGVSSGIKEHSRKLATSNIETRKVAARASIEAMRIFYRKHYMDKYPRVVTWIILLAIGVLERMRLWRIAM